MFKIFPFSYLYGWFIEPGTNFHSFILPWLEVSALTIRLESCCSITLDDTQLEDYTQLWTAWNLCFGDTSRCVFFSSTYPGSVSINIQRCSKYIMILQFGGRYFNLTTVIRVTQATSVLIWIPSRQSNAVDKAPQSRTELYAWRGARRSQLARHAAGSGSLASVHHVRYPSVTTGHDALMFPFPSRYATE